MRKITIQDWIVVVLCAVVIMVVAVLLLSTTHHGHGTPVNRTRVAFYSLNAAIEGYRCNRHHYPATIQDLVGHSEGASDVRESETIYLAPMFPSL
jgi:hypothetical protein